MIGNYEQVPAFGFRRKKVFEVVDQGIQYRGQLYKWSEIKDFKKSHGIGYIYFNNGDKCRIHMNSFRKQGQRGHISLFGDNPTFNKLAGHWYGKKLELLKPPKLKQVESELTYLADALDSASSPDEISRIERMLSKVNNEYLQLNIQYLNHLDAEYKKFSKKQKIRLAMVIILAVFVVIMVITSF